ncbi:hypothetical protein ACIQU4_28120 [Streptomyces sp. NPDC090741]
MLLIPKFLNAPTPHQDGDPTDTIIEEALRRVRQGGAQGGPR